MKNPFRTTSIGDIQKRTGDISRLATAEVFERLEGAGRGSRVARLSVPGGFDIEILPDRGMDLGAVSWRGVPVAWVSAAGVSAPALLDPGSNGWRRSFGGGLLATCGFDQFGEESRGTASILPLHGRANTLISSQFHVWSSEIEGDWSVGASGQTRQSTAFGEDLRLTRLISTALADSTIRIADVVTNDGQSEWPHMILYHLNFGWPFLSEGSTIAVTYLLDGELSVIDQPTPRDVAATSGLTSWQSITAPVDSYPEQVFHCKFPAGAHVTVAISNPLEATQVSVRFSADQLPHLYLWKMLQNGVYVVGVEPANCAGILGQLSLKNAGMLPSIESRGSRSYDISVAINELS